jgi:F-type H+-transporting ATPase subunit b
MINFIDTAWASEAVAEEATHTTEEGGTSGGVLADLGINGTLFVAQLINFALVAMILWFLILKPLTKKMAERQKMIDESIDNAKKIQENLNKSEKEYQTRIDQSKVDANKIMEKTTLAAAAATEEAKVLARKEIEQLVLQARKSIIEEKDIMSSELKAETANFIILALEKVIGEKFDAAKDKAFIEDILKKLK